MIMILQEGEELVESSSFCSSSPPFVHYYYIIGIIIVSVIKLASFSHKSTECRVLASCVGAAGQHQWVVY